ncbi:PhzF family isomerase [Kiloniella sp.]|uniref:PhzF family isomerase n=1 Tax=Kiloniella sp. TaxID=1938587 RepID=UPI003B0297F6
MSNLEGLIIYQVDAFTHAKFSGNPAGVVPDADRLTNQQMQSIARELNNSETVFILKPDGDDHDLRLRYFTPTTEVPSCGHATIAAHFVRAQELGITSGRVMQKIGTGILPIDIERNDNEIRVTMTQGKPEFSPTMSDKVITRIEDALGIKSTDRYQKLPVRIVSTGHSKVMIALNSKSCLQSLRPDHAALSNLSKEIGCNGYFTFTLSDQNKRPLIHGRMFAPAIGIDEDPVTGNANGPVGAYLVEERFPDIENGTFHFHARQGEAMGRPGDVEVFVEIKDYRPQSVRISGSAVNVFKAVL